MAGIELSHNSLLFSKKIIGIFLLLPLIAVNPAFAESTEIQMDWLIEGQLEKKALQHKKLKLFPAMKNLLLKIQNLQNQSMINSLLVTNTLLEITKLQLILKKVKF